MSIPKGYKLVPVETLKFALGLTRHGFKNRTDQEADKYAALKAITELLESPTPPISSPVSWQYRHKFEEDGEIEIGLWQHCEEKIYDLLQGRKNTETRQLYTASTVCTPNPPQPIYDEAKERDLCKQDWLNTWTKTDSSFEFYLEGWIACAQYRAKAVEVGHE